MSNSLVNPLWIYLIDVISNLKVISIISLSVGICACVIFGVWYFCKVSDGYYDDEDIELKMTKSWFKISIIATIISSIFTCTIPSEKTMYTMFVTSYLTEENITNATESVTDIVDYIFEKVDQLQGE